MMILQGIHFGGGGLKARLSLLQRGSPKESTHVALIAGLYGYTEFMAQD